MHLVGFTIEIFQNTLAYCWKSKRPSRNMHEYSIVCNYTKCFVHVHITILVTSCYSFLYTQQYHVMLGTILTWETWRVVCVGQEHSLWVVDFCLTRGMNYQKDSTRKWNLFILPSVHLEDIAVKSTAASKTSLIVEVCKLEKSTNCFHTMPIIYLFHNKWWLT